MQNTAAQKHSHESVHEGHHHLVCWKSIFAGTLTALICFVALSALGAAVAGFTAEGMIDRSSSSNGAAIATGAGLWLGLSVVISLFIGSYLALRVSRFVTARTGAAHGIVILSIFFLTLLMGAGKLVGGLAQGVGQLAQGASEGTAGLASSPYVQDTLNKALGDAKLKSEPKDVAQGLVVRLMAGDTESAKNYYAYQTGQTEAQVNDKITQLKADFDAAAKRAGEQTARIVGDVGITLFILIMVGLMGVLAGGVVGADANTEKPFAKSLTATPSPTTTYAGLGNQRGSVVPYLFGWLLGVPVSVLLLIAMLRSIF